MPRRRRKERKTLVFEIKLFKDANGQYECNYKEMMKEHEESDQEG